MKSTQQQDRQSRSSRWQLLLDQLLSSPTRLHSYRNLSRRIAEDTMRYNDCGKCQ